MKAIIIDVEDIFWQLLSEIMERAGYNVILAATGKKGWDILQRNADADVALVDWRMPEMDGLDFIRKVNADPRFDNMRLILVTGRQDIEDISKAFANGAHEYLVKPFTPDMVFDKLRVCGLSVDPHA